MDKTIRFTKMMQKAVEYYRINNADNVTATLEDSYVLRCIIVEWACDHLDAKQFSDVVTK